jgi:hypothetical protein
MKKRGIIFPLLLILSIFVVSSCATTTPTSVWKDAEYKGQIEKVFVIGVARKPRYRRFFEDEFVRRLKSSGIEAVSSYEVLPNVLNLNSETIRSIMDAEIVEGYITPSAPPISENDNYGFVYSRGAKFYDENIVLKTNLYNVETEKLFWSALSETYVLEYADRYKETGKFIQVMFELLKKDKLIK